MNLRILASAAAVAALAALPRATAAPLSLADLPALVLANDASAVSAARSVEAAYHGYRGTLADALPQIDLSTGYTLAYAPAETVTGPPTVEISDYALQGATARVSASQLLPTGGNLVLALEDALSVTTIGSRTVTLPPSPPTYPDPDYSQKPRATLSLAQPVLINGKLVDFELFAATKRKAELGWVKEQAAERVATGRALAQAVQLYFTVVQQRQAAAQLQRSLDLSQRRLGTLGENVRLGIATETDLVEARIADGRQRQSLLDLRSSLARTERLLAAAVGRASLRDVELADGVPSWTRAGDADVLVNAALTANGTLLQGSLAVEERAADAVLAGQRYAANLTLSLSVAGQRNPELTGRGFGQSFSDLFADGAGVDWNASVNLAVPLYDGGSRREQKAVSAALTASVGQALESRRQAVLDDLAAALERRAILEERVTLLAEAVDLAARRLADERSLLSLGRSTDNDVDARIIDVEVKENDLWRARADLLLANLDIASLAGDDLARILEGLPR
jgi:outer membrane protein TolC